MKKVSGFVVLVCLAFVWIHSAMGTDASSAESSFVFELLKPILSIFLDSSKVTHHLVRKLAHVTEFFVLSLSINWHFFTFKSSPLKALLAGFCCAFMDETVQIFSNRGYSIIDVWIDLIGVACACLLFLVIKAFVKNRRG